MAKIYLNLAKIMLRVGICAIVFSLFFGSISPVFAADPLRLYGIAISRNDENATISWTTTIPAYGIVEYGTEQGIYRHAVNAPDRKTSQVVVLEGLNSNTRYYFRVTAYAQNEEVSSSEFYFNTQQSADQIAPIITKVEVAYTSGTTATIQWRTNEPATTEVEYGRTESYGQTVADNNLKTIHDITVTGLQDGTFYHFVAKSTDRHGNRTIWQDMTFTTKVTNVSDREELVIYAVEPNSNNYEKVSLTAATISWRTNVPAKGVVLLGENRNQLYRQAETFAPRHFFSSVSYTNLRPNTTYYYKIMATDTRGKTAESQIYSFVTRARQTQPTTPVVTPPQQNGGVLGDRACAINTNQRGFYGYYYNHTAAHPDFQITPYTDWHIVGRDNDWYNQKYLSFSRVDQNLQFGQFEPVNEGKEDDPNLFAVNWRAAMYVPATDTYTFRISSDDDSWVLVDGRVVIDNGGLHEAEEISHSITLTRGYHLFEIYYADRHTPQAIFDFTYSGNLQFIPLQLGCSVTGLNQPNQPTQPVPQPETPTYPGEVLGDRVDNRGYACDPNRGYTRFTALYKSAERPDVWAITENGKRHYITSPAAFKKYGCNWNEIQFVSQRTLDNIPTARLVRTPSDPTIYYLFQRPQQQWLKINLHSPSIFISYQGNSWGDTVFVDALDINAYPNVRLVKSMNSNSVYLLENGYKRLIASEEAFNRLGYDWVEVATINDFHLQSFQTGQTIY